MSTSIGSQETDLIHALASVVNGLVDKTTESRIDFMQIQLQAERDRTDPESLPAIEMHGRLAAGYFALAVEVQAAMGSLALLEGREAPETLFRLMHPSTRMQLTALAAERGFTIDQSVLNAIPHCVATQKYDRHLR